jgi:hypothetical protein
MKILGIDSELIGGKIVSITREGVKVDVKGKSVVLTLAEVESIVFGG